MIILYTALVAVVLAFVLGFLLGFFKKVFYVQEDPLQGKIRAALPGANCGGCGFPGCDGYAAAVAKGKSSVDGCSAGGKQTAQKLAEIMGVQSSAEEQIAILACQGSKEHAFLKGEYIGISTCAGAKQSIGGTKMCAWGCIGFGDCVEACRFDAIHIAESGLPEIDKQKCTGCGMCVKTCPQHLLARIPVERKGSIALCSNRSQNKPSIIKQCKSGCIKCGKCERTCKQGAIKLVDGIPVTDYTKCIACGECVAGCPTKVLFLLTE